MKGVVFTQFPDFVAQTWAVETTDEIVHPQCLKEGLNLEGAASCVLPMRLAATAMWDVSDPDEELTIGLQP